MSSYARMGSLANKYAWLAMLHYGKAKEKAERILQAEYYSDELSILKRQFENDVLIGVNFSAMALEAFFNDYVAYKLGDAFYYDNFEMLRPMGKFQMIMKFIFHQDIAKGESLYQLIDKLFKLRNGYVHNKSKDAHGKGMSEEEFLYFQSLDISMDNEEEWLLNDVKEDVKGHLREVTDAVKALIETAKKVDELDKDDIVLSLLLSSRLVGLYDKEELEMIRRVQREFHVPESMDCREM